MKLSVVQYSPTYVNLLVLLRTTPLRKSNTYQTLQNGGKFTQIDVNKKSDRLVQDFFMSPQELFTLCTPHEWYLVGRIATELKRYNALWYCDPRLKNNSQIKKSIRGLIAKKVLVETETTHIYLVNPFYMRRGDFSVVLNSTIDSLAGVKKVTQDYIVDLKPVREKDTSIEQDEVAMEPEYSVLVQSLLPINLEYATETSTS